MKRIDQIKIGDVAELRHVVTQQDIDKFVALSGDDNKLHVDAEFAATTSFKKPVAHGMIGASFISTIIGTQLPGDGALWFAQSLEFLLPARVGDILTVRAQVIKKHENQNIIEPQTDIYNQYRQKVTSGQAKVRLIESEQPAPSGVTSTVPRVALVIGATGGIGAAVCQQLAEDGFDIALHYHSEKDTAENLSLRLASNHRQVLLVQADITQPESVASMVDAVIRKFGGIYVVVNCATIKVPNIKFLQLEWRDMENHWQVNVKGAFNLAKAVIPVMTQQRFGKIINFSSKECETPSPEWLHYNTAKMALIGFSRSLAVEMAPKGIRVNLISPGMTDTALIADVPEKAKLMAAARTPLQRLATTEDVAGGVSFLASSKADYITGETLRINGGQVML